MGGAVYCVIFSRLLHLISLKRSNVIKTEVLKLSSYRIISESACMNESMDNRKGRVTGGLRCTLEKYVSAIKVGVINTRVLRRSTQHVHLCTELDLKAAEGRRAIGRRVSLFRRWRGSIVACHKDRLSDGNQSNGLANSCQHEEDARANKQSRQTRVQINGSNIHGS